MAMQRARRLALGALLILLGGLAVAGCRSEPSVAVYVGNVAYTNADVDRIVNPAGGRTDAAVTVTPQWVVRLIVTRDLAKQLAAEKNVTVEQVDVSGVLQMPPSDEYAKLWSEVYALQRALVGSVRPQPVSDEDLSRFYQAGVAAGLFRPDVPLPDLREALAGADVAWFGLRNLIADAAATHHVTVNPRFAPLALPILVRPGGQVFQLTVPFPVDTTTGVRDSA
jgi:hypothetical protein